PSRPVYAPDPGSAGKTIRIVRAVEKSLRPAPRPGSAGDTPDDDVLVAMQAGIQETLALIDLDAPVKAPLIALNAPGAPLISPLKPRPRPAEIVVAARAPAPTPTSDTGLEIVTRMSTSGGHHWAITVGEYRSRHEAEKMLLQTALLELETLDEALRKVVERRTGFQANFVGLSEGDADLACRRLVARGVECAPLGPG
ncbi:MAG: D-alanyl-D-alanine carboxypeptidase, partial [Alphaproteobacteria bacterium]|nr:D-alanyl-D-alanine carboxypeptidase [Alphaproteobacteria bacterium]